MPTASGSAWPRISPRLVCGCCFVADDIPDPLKRVVECLNAQMAGIEVLAVEIKQFKSDSRQTLVPRVIGRTAASPRISSVGHGTRRPKLDRESFLSVFTIPEHHGVGVRLLDVAGKSGGVPDWGVNGVCIRISCSLWKKPVGVAWVFPPSELGKVVWRGLTNILFGTTVKPPDTTAAISPEEDEVYVSLRHWMEEVAGCDFTKEVSGSVYLARTISYDDDARHIDRLASGVAGLSRRSDR